MTDRTGSDCGCTLTCDLPEDAKGERAAEIRAALLPHVRERATVEGGFAWEFAAETSRERLERIVALERECCSGLDFALVERDDRPRLEVRGDGAEIWALLLGEEKAASGGC